MDKHQLRMEILLVNSNFMASDYIWKSEVALAMKLHYSGQAIVVPIIVRSIDWADAPFARLQALPKDGKAISRWEDRDAAFVNIAAGIRKLV
jgi:hypothetical protein